MFFELFSFLISFYLFLHIKNEYMGRPGSHIMSHLCYSRKYFLQYLFRKESYVLNKQSKVNCYRKVYSYLKQCKGILNLGFPPQEQRQHYDIFFDVGEMHVDYRLRSDKDLLLIRVSEKLPDWMEEADAREFCKNELNSNQYRWFAENSKLSGSYTLPLSGLSEENAQKKANDGAEEFVQYLISKKDTIAAFFEKPEPASVDAPIEEGMSDKDLFFNKAEDLEKLGVTEKEQMENPNPGVATGKSLEKNPPVPMPMPKPIESVSTDVLEKDTFKSEQGKTSLNDNAQNIAEKSSAGNDSMDKKSVSSDMDQASAYHEKQSDFESFRSTQIADIERRQQMVKRMEEAVDDKIRDYQKKNKDLLRLQEEVLSMKAKNEKDSADIAERGVLTKELQNKNQMILILQENIKAKEKEMERSTFFSGLFPEPDTVDKQTHESCVKALQVSEENVQNLQDEVSRLVSENNKLRRLYSGIQSATDKEKENVSQLKEHIQQLKKQLSDSTSKATDLKEKLEQIQMKTVQPIHIEDFENAGFSVKEIVGERDGLYELSSVSDSILPDGINVIVDIVHRIALLQKKFRRGKKFLHTVNTWNENDLLASYQMSNDQLIVKKFLYNEDAVSDLGDAIKRMDSLR